MAGEINLAEMLLANPATLLTLPDEVFVPDQVADANIVAGATCSALEAQGFSLADGFWLSARVLGRVVGGAIDTSETPLEQRRSALRVFARRFAELPAEQRRQAAMAVRNHAARFAPQAPVPQPSTLPESTRALIANIEQETAPLIQFLQPECRALDRVQKTIALPNGVEVKVSVLAAVQTDGSGFVHLRRTSLYLQIKGSNGIPYDADAFVRLVQVFAKMNALFQQTEGIEVQGFIGAFQIKTKDGKLAVTMADAPNFDPSLSVHLSQGNASFYAEWLRLFLEAHAPYLTIVPLS